MIWRVVWRATTQNVMMTLEYRWAFLIYMINVTVGPLISLLVWLTVSEQGVPLPYNRSQFVTYYVLLSVVSMLTGTWGAEYIGRSIRLGQLSPWLLRPVPYITNFVANNMVEKVIKLPLLLPLVMLVSAFSTTIYIFQLRHWPGCSFLWRSCSRRLLHFCSTL